MKNSIQTYASKAAAKKGAARKGIEIGVVEFIKNEEGRWIWQETALENVVSPCSVTVPSVGIKIEKDRPEQNGITRPSIGGKCRAIWDYCDAQYKNNVIPMPKQMRTIAQENGWNENNAVIEMYQWRKFNGFKSRV